MTPRDARSARARRGRAGPLSLIHRNNSPKPVGIGVSGRSVPDSGTLYFVGLLDSEKFDLVETLAEAEAIRDRLVATQGGPVVMMRLQPTGGANGVT